MKPADGSLAQVLVVLSAKAALQLSAGALTATDAARDAVAGALLAAGFVDVEIRESQVTYQINSPLALDACPVCGLPGYATETDEEGRHPECSYAEGSIALEPCSECGAETFSDVLTTSGQGAADQRALCRECVEGGAS